MQQPKPTCGITLSKAQRRIVDAMRGGATVTCNDLTTWRLQTGDATTRLRRSACEALHRMGVIKTSSPWSGECSEEVWVLSDEWEAR